MDGRIRIQVGGGAVAEIVVLALSLNRVVAVVFVGAVVGTAFGPRVIILAIGLP
jgi:hypothetical protein